MPHCGILLSWAVLLKSRFFSSPGLRPKRWIWIGADGIDAIAVYLADQPEAGNVIPGAGGVGKLRWAAKGKGKRGGARIIYLYVFAAGEFT
jgi:hypothetical protein